MHPDKGVAERRSKNIRDMEKELREANRLLETIFDHTHLMLAYLDPQFNFIRVNRAYAVADGQEPSYFPGKNHFDLYPDTGNEAIFRRVAETGEPYIAFSKPFKYARYPERGASYWDWSLVPVKDESGAVSSLLLTLLNVTGLRNAEEFLNNILESINEGLIVLDREYRIVSANRAYLGMVALPPDKVIGRHCYELSCYADEPCHEPPVNCPVKYTFETGKPHTALFVRKVAGKLLYAETKSYPMRNAEGDIVSVIEIINDVTEKCKLEEHLLQAQKMEAVGHLAGGVAHDFNNILTAIIGYTSVMQMKMRHDDPLRTNLDQILASADRAAGLTQSLLAFSRKQTANPAPVNLNTVIEKTKMFLLRVIGEQIELKTELTDRELTVMADPVQLEQVLINLATNARDAMPGGGSLTISSELMKLDDEFILAHGFGEPGDYAFIFVTDSGIGMDAKTIERIFEPFFTTKEVGKGTGLGLSIVYGIVKQHNGYITCYSEPGKGTTFRIYLPTIKSDKVREIKAAEAVVPTGGTETILIAEDDDAVRKFERQVLEGFGYRVLEAVNGEEAVETFMENMDRIDLLLFDFIMPRMNGWEAYEKIREARPDIRVLFASGYPEDYIHKKEIPEKDVKMVLKPIPPTTLLKKVREVLDQ
ncbi:MAG: PAS domain-containing sensor histidine kinase [Nitrospiraceae bacterium]|nr:MAG: PAS domain-containing sensor histidine kinase [Nitrospiraceae bacterium]